MMSAAEQAYLRMEERLGAAELERDRAIFERDALQRQVDAVRALVPSPNQPGRWVLPDDEDAPAVWVYDIDAALDAAEPADQPTVPVITDDPDGFFTPISDGETWLVEPAGLSDSVGTNAEPADAGRQPHPTPEADER